MVREIQSTAAICREPLAITIKTQMAPSERPIRTAVRSSPTSLFDKAARRIAIIGRAATPAWAAALIWRLANNGAASKLMPVAAALVMKRAVEAVPLPVTYEPIAPIAAVKAAAG